MDELSSRALIDLYYSHLLGREPSQAEMVGWEHQLAHGKSALDLMRSFVSSAEYKRRTAVKCAFPSGHFHSPVVDPALVGAYVTHTSNLDPKDIAGIDVSLDDMRHLWTTNSSSFRQTPFPEAKIDRRRFYYNSSPFPPGDAVSLRGIMSIYRPRKIVEIGSGFSTACMLDSADGSGMPELKITCIEPYPARLKSLLREEDYRRVTLIESGVQDVPLSVFEALAPNDILFIDSTHVLKTGSDVHYELFSILPVIASGVLVHFHDVQFPFEYPSKWVHDLNYSWNEAYALRAFLMYNPDFKIVFWGSALARYYREELTQECPEFMRNPGGSIWLQRV